MNKFFGHCLHSLNYPLVLKCGQKIAEVSGKLIEVFMMFQQARFDVIAGSNTKGLLAASCQHLFVLFHRSMCLGQRLRH